MKMKWLTVSIILFPLIAQAEELYKCRKENGATVYSDMPCAHAAYDKQQKTSEKVVALGQARFDENSQPRAAYPARSNSARSTTSRGGNWHCE